MVTKLTVLPAQISMCEFARLRSVNDMCHVVMQRRMATLKDRKVGNSVNKRTYKCVVHIFSFSLAPSILYKAKQKLLMGSKFKTPYPISIYQKWHLCPLLTMIRNTNSLCTRCGATDTIIYIVTFPSTWSLLWFHWGKVSLSYQIIKFFLSAQVLKSQQPFFWAKLLERKDQKERWNVINRSPEEEGHSSWRSEVTKPYIVPERN